MKRYVVGYLLSPGHRQVVLIKKLKPSWQAGKLNGPGGKLEEGETPAQCMRREFREEAGLDLPEDRWLRFGSMGGDGQRTGDGPWTCDLYVAVAANRTEWDRVVTSTTEEICLREVSEVLLGRTTPAAMSNVASHLALALHALATPDWYMEARISYTRDLGREPTKETQ